MSVVVDLDEFMPDELAPELPKRARPGSARRMPHQRMRRRPQPDPEPENFYPDLAAFVSGFLAPTYAHEWTKLSSEWRWCSRWWLHTEAVVRLEAMWRAWEALRLDPGTGASTWLLHHADPHLAALSSSSGPFRQCKPGEHAGPPPLVTEDPPPGMFSPAL